jgi:hypothetical protein
VDKVNVDINVGIMNNENNMIVIIVNIFLKEYILTNNERFLPYKGRITDTLRWEFVMNK